MVYGLSLRVHFNGAQRGRGVGHITIDRTRPTRPLGHLMGAGNLEGRLFYEVVSEHSATRCSLAAGAIRLLKVRNYVVATKIHSPIRVVRLLPVLDFGGVETRVIQQSVGMDRSGFDFRVCAFRNAGDAAKRIEEAGVQVDMLDVDPAIRNPQATLALASYLRSNPTDILHCSINEANFHGTVASLLTPVSCVVVEEVGDPLVRSWRGHLVVGLTMHLADYCIGVSRPVARYLSKGLFVPSKKVVHIDNGVLEIDQPTQEECQRARTELGIPLDALVVGSVGRLNDKHKRFSHLLEAVERLQVDLPNTYVLIVGDGPDRARLQNMVEQSSLSDRVIMPGFRSDMKNMYACMDVFSLLSEQEAFGLVVAEAMFCGLPVVVSDVGGMSDIVVEGETGFKVPRLRPEIAAERLFSLLKDPAKRSKMGEAGRLRAVEKYGSQRYNADVRSLYERLGRELGLVGKD